LLVGVVEEFGDLGPVVGGVTEGGQAEVAGDEDPVLERGVGVGLGQDREAVPQADVILQRQVAGA